MEPGQVLFLRETPEPRQLHHSRLYGAGGVRIRAGQVAIGPFKACGIVAYALGAGFNHALVAQPRQHHSTLR